MEVIDVINSQLGGLSDRERDFILKRGAFVMGYAAMKNWTAPFSLEQVMELRRQEGWRNPLAMPTH